MTIFGYPLEPHFNNAADETPITVKSDEAFLGHLEVSNINADDLFIQLFDTASPTVGTITPIQSLLIPQGNTTVRGALDQVWGNGLHFTAALAYAVTTTPTGSTGPAVAVTVNIAYV